MENVHGVVDEKAAIHLGPDFLMISETYKNTRFENIDNVFNISQ